MERFYFGDAGVDRPALRELLHRFPGAPPNTVKRHPWAPDPEVDINYGWAVAEATWTRTGVHDPTRARRMRHALATVLAWNASRIDREFDNRHLPVNRDPQCPRVAIPDDNPHAGPLIAAAYGA